MTTLTTRKPGQKTDPRRFPCGHPRSKANTAVRPVKGKTWTSDVCRTCENARRNKRQRAVHAAVKPAKSRVYVPVRKPYIVAPHFDRILAECRPAYLRAVGGSA